jgi:alkyl sulfatase BDS1-like metallo-beta-lactamase superfamily hydrolase
MRSRLGFASVAAAAIVLSMLSVPAVAAEDTADRAEIASATNGPRVAIRARFPRARVDRPPPPRGCPPDDPCRVITDPRDFTPPPPAALPIGDTVLQIQDSIYVAPGFGNTFLVTTPEGNVIIDTSISLLAPAHEAALRAIDAGSVKYIILTHAHADHVGGVDLWKEPDTKIIGQAHEVDFLDYERRLDGIFRNRNASQFSELLGLPPLPFNPPDAPVVNHGGVPPANVFVDRFHEFELGGLTFQVVHTPGETPDHLTVWIPEYKIAFPGDNFYLSFPNLYTLRGTRPRWALEYVESLDRVLSWEPEILAPSHGDPIFGRDAVQERVRAYRDAIQYVHDETVRGINAGKDVHTLMREVRLPPHLQTQDTGEVYGRIDWSVRGIFDGYVGWFDGNVSNMYPAAPESIDAEVVALAGGADAIASRARDLLSGGDPQRALHMADLALRSDPANRAALEVRRDAVALLLEAAVNSNERGWLTAALREVEAKLGADATP